MVLYPGLSNMFEDWRSERLFNLRVGECQARHTYGNRNNSSLITQYGVGSGVYNHGSHQESCRGVQLWFRRFGFAEREKSGAHEHRRPTTWNMKTGARNLTSSLSSQRILYVFEQQKYNAGLEMRPVEVRWPRRRNDRVEYRPTLNARCTSGSPLHYVKSSLIQAQVK